MYPLGYPPYTGRYQCESEWSGMSIGIGVVIVEECRECKRMRIIKSTLPTTMTYAATTNTTTTHHSWTHPPPTAVKERRDGGSISGWGSAEPVECTTTHQTIHSASSTFRLINKFDFLFNAQQINSLVPGYHKNWNIYVALWWARFIFGFLMATTYSIFIYSCA